MPSPETKKDNLGKSLQNQQLEALSYQLNKIF